MSKSEIKKDLGRVIKKIKKNMTNKPTENKETNPLEIKPFIKKSPSAFNSDPYNTRNSKSKAGNKFDKKSSAPKAKSINTSSRKGGSGGDR